jgi:hypothetical protein
MPLWKIEERPMFSETELRAYRWRIINSSAFCGVMAVNQAQRFLSAHAAVSNLFNLGRHLVRVHHYRNLRMSAVA